MSPLTPQDIYIHSVVFQNSPAVLPTGSLATVASILQEWAHIHLVELKPSGSFAKGTAVLGSAEYDVFISINQTGLTGVPSVR